MVGIFQICKRITRRSRFEWLLRVDFLCCRVYETSICLFRIGHLPSLPKVGRIDEVAQERIDKPSPSSSLLTSEPDQIRSSRGVDPETQGNVGRNEKRKETSKHTLSNPLTTQGSRFDPTNSIEIPHTHTTQTQDDRKMGLETHEGARDRKREKTRQKDKADA